MIDTSLAGEIAVGLDYVGYADIERYLFGEVHRRFHADGSIGAFDFFSIVIWKANRAKSKVARRLLSNDQRKRRSLEPIVRDLTASLHRATDAKARLRILMRGWAFRLAMATAVLTVLWPDEFTVDDVRAASARVSSWSPCAVRAARICSVAHSMPLAPSSLPNASRWRAASASIRSWGPSTGTVLTERLLATRPAQFTYRS